MTDKLDQDVYRLTGVGFSYGAYNALTGIDFALGVGESLAVLGANGSGKSTLLKILNGLVFPETGSVTFFGTELTEANLKGDFLRCFRERVGFVFSEPDVQLFCQTVFDEVAFGPLQLGLGEDTVRARVDDLLGMLGIRALGERPPYSLSTGEKKKVAIASVLATDPEILLMDEPTTGLDPRTQVWLFELVEELKKLGKTFVIATHDLSLVQDHTERAVVLDEKHSLAADGPVADVLGDKDMLLRVNIIHEHTHRHGDVTHTHSHGPYSIHDEHE